MQDSVSPEITELENAGVPTEGVKEPTEPRQQMYKVKIDGVETEVDLRTLTSEYQKGKGSEKRFQEAQRMRAQAEQFISALQTNPIDVLTNPNLGIDFRKVAEDYLYAQIQSEMMSPEERAQKEQVSELERYRAQEQQRVEQQREQRANQMRDKYANEYTEKFTSALQETGLPKTNWTVSRMANYMQQALQSGIDADVKDIAALVKEDYMTEQKELFSNLDGDKLIETFGEDMAKKIRQADLAKLKSASGPKSSGQPIPKPAQRDQRMDRADWIKSLKQTNGL
jgi:hypothetical protein